MAKGEFGKYVQRTTAETNENALTNNSIFTPRQKKDKRF
jgi:hypothetical protein